MTVTLIHWNTAESKERARQLRDAELKVKLECEARDGPAILRRLSESRPDAVLISLDRLPTQGRDVGMALRTRKPTRSIPLIFVGGDAAKAERVRQILPDAAFCAWEDAAKALRRAIAKPPVDPVVPSSNLAGYSGTPLPKKLGIKPASSIALLGEPDGFVEILEPLPDGVQFTTRLLPSTAVAIWFVRMAAELASQIDSVARQVIAARACRLWIAWPKRTSRLASDVNENLVRTTALAAGLVDYKVAAIDADWSGLLFAPRKG